MHLQLDTQRMRAAMDLWRQEQSAAPHVDTLSGLTATLAGWLDLLHLCTPGPAEAAELQAMVAEVEQLREWAGETAAALRLTQQVPDVR